MPALPQASGLPVLQPVVAVLLLSALAAHAETRLADSVVVDDVLRDNLYALAGEVRVAGSVEGAVVLAAGNAVISGDVEGDVIVAGGRIDISGGVGDDLRAAGGTVRIGGFVTDQATITGGTVTLEPGSAIAGRTWIAAGDVDIAGQVGDHLRIAAGTVVISGRVAGDVEIAAREIRVEPGAVIGGDLVWRSKTPPVIAEEARILGEVRAAGEGQLPSVLDDAPDRFAGSWALGIALAVAALVLSWFAPQLVARSAAAFRAAPLRTLGLGAASLVLTPVLAVVLFATVLGWLLGFVVLAAYVFGLMLSGLIGLLIGASVLRSRLEPASAPTPAPTLAMSAGGWRGAMILLVLVVALVLAQRVPPLGGLLSSLLVVAGFGALTALVTGRGPPAAR